MHTAHLAAIPTPPGRTVIYESNDGGVTWERLVEFDLPWIATRVLPDENGEVRLLLTARRPFGVDGSYSPPPPPILWPSGETVKLPVRAGYELYGAGRGYQSGLGLVALDDGRLAWGMNPHPERVRADLYLTAEGEDVTELVLEQTDSCPICLKLPDGRLLLMEYYNVEELIGPRGAAEGRARLYDHVPWPTIWDPETGEQWPIEMPYEVLRPEEDLFPLAVQQGPFLRVIGLEEGCLPLRADRSNSSEELACVAEGVLLQTRARIGITDEEGITWYWGRTPAGLEGWADGRYLE